MQMIVDHCRQQVVCCSHCMEVASEVQVEKFHRNHLAIATTRCSTLDAKCWPHGWLTQTDHGFFADVFHRHSQTNCCCGLAFAQRCWSDCSHHDIFCFRSIFQFLDCVHADLGKTGAVGLEQVLANTHLLRDLFEWKGFSGARDFKIRWK